MSEVTPDLSAEAELASLKARAKTLGIEHSPNIGLDKLREKVNTFLSIPDEPEPVRTLYQDIYDEEMKLIRIKLTNMNPRKRGLPSEVFTVANEYLGTVRKVIPYEEEFYENGFHVPNCIYKLLRDKEYIHISTRKEDKLRVDIPIARMVKEFNIEVLPPLTDKEIKELQLAELAREGKAV